MNELLVDTLYSTIPYQGATDTTNTFSDSIYQSLNHVFYEDYPPIADSTLQQQKAFFTESTSQNIQLQPKTEIFFDWFFCCSPTVRPYRKSALLPSFSVACQPSDPYVLHSFRV